MLKQTDYNSLKLFFDCYENNKDKHINIFREALFTTLEINFPLDNSKEKERSLREIYSKISMAISILREDDYRLIQKVILSIIRLLKKEKKEKKESYHPEYFVDAMMQIVLIIELDKELHKELLNAIKKTFKDDFIKDIKELNESYIKFYMFYEKSIKEILKFIKLCGIEEFHNLNQLNKSGIIRITPSSPNYDHFVLKFNPHFEK